MALRDPKRVNPAIQWDRQETPNSVGGVKLDHVYHVDDDGNVVDDDDDDDGCSLVFSLLCSFYQLVYLWR